MTATPATKKQTESSTASTVPLLSPGPTRDGNLARVGSQDDSEGRPHRHSASSSFDEDSTSDQVDKDPQRKGLKPHPRGDASANDLEVDTSDDTDSHSGVGPLPFMPEYKSGTNVVPVRLQVISDAAEVRSAAPHSDVPDESFS